jgi:endonuclease/exonuclease/phosphatase family metal-dependent hydrolase
MAATKADPTPATPQPHGGLSIVVASINIAKVTAVDVIAREIETKPTLLQADVLLLQEVVRATDRQPSVAELLANRLGRNVLFASPDGNTTFSGVSILSPGPLSGTRVIPLRNFNLIFRTRKRIALAATVQTVLGPVRFVNVHLDTRINPGGRVEQLRPALDDAASGQSPAVVAGDFNTNDMQWVSNVVPVPWPGWQASRVRELMAARGFETPFQVRRATFDHLGMQLDWIYSTGLTAISSGIEPLDFSDHHAVWAQLTTR